MDDSKREKVVLAAQALFSKYGFFKTTIDEISARSGVAKSTIYTRYRSKEELIEEVIRKEGNYLFSEIKKAVNNVTGPAEKMNALIRTRLFTTGKLINFYSAINDDYREHHEFIERARAKNLEDETEAIKEILEEGIRTGVFTVKDPSLTAFVIISSMKGLDFPKDDHVKMPDTLEKIDHFIELLFSGILKR